MLIKGLCKPRAMKEIVDAVGIHYTKNRLKLTAFYCLVFGVHIISCSHYQGCAKKHYPMMSYTEALDYLYRLQLHGIAPGLSRINHLLSALDAPHRKFPSIHIAGTNGKGSTAAMTASILKQAGFRVGLYTSPHLIDFSERIAINSIPISQEEMIQLTECIKKQVDRLSILITFFEFTTAMAFCYFAKNAVDIAVIEVGLGGRFDATNVLTPKICAITQIGMDHEQYLGHTLLEIAKEKAGIIKEGVPIITGATPPEVITCIEETAHHKNAPLIRLGQDLLVSGTSPQLFLYQNGSKKRTVSCPLLGKHQIANAAIAMGIVETLSDFPVSEEAILEGIAKVEWPGRLQIIQHEPWIFLDGAHNPSGIAALVSFLEERDQKRSGRNWLIIGIMQDKNIKEMLAPFSNWADKVVFTRPNIERAADVTTLSTALDSAVSQTAKASVSDAIEFVRSEIAPCDTLVITGSLYTVAEALAHFKGTTVSPIRG
jgi:dihydrofolate synthase/folylpolyglutamate synthase